MRATTLVSLRNAAKQVKLAAAPTKCFYKDMSHAPIYKWACPRAIEYNKEPVLGQFFTPAACSVLRTMPNEYWFFALIEATLDAVVPSQNDSTVDHIEVHLGLVSLRRTRSAYDLDKQLPLLTEPERYSRIAAGILVVKLAERYAVGAATGLRLVVCVDQAELVVNPIFASNVR